MWAYKSNSINKHKNKRNNNSYANKSISNNDRIEANNKFHSSDKDLGYKRLYLSKNTFQNYFNSSIQKNKTAKSFSNLKNKIKKMKYIIIIIL